MAGSSFGRHDYRDPAREKYGKPGVTYPWGSLAHPMLVEKFTHRKDQTAGTVPYLTASPRLTGTILTHQDSSKGDDDSVNQTTVYETIPSPWLYDVVLDDKMLAFVFSARRKNKITDINPASIIYTGTSATATTTLSGTSITAPVITNGGSNYAPFVGLAFTKAPDGGRTAQGYGMTVNGVLTTIKITDAGSGYLAIPTVTVLPQTLWNVERKDIDVNIAWEVSTWITQPLFRDVNNALQTVRTENREFPGRININYAQRYYPLTINQSPYALNIPVKKKTYWVFSETEPVVVFDSLYPNDILLSIGGNPVTFLKVLHDAATVEYVDGNGDALVVYLPATVPSYSEYTGASGLTGSILLTHGSTAIVGTGTAFLTQLANGYLINGSTALQIAGVADNTHATLAVAFTGDTVTLTNSFAVNAVIAWIGNDKNVSGEVQDEKWAKLWRVELEYVNMR